MPLLTTRRALWLPGVAVLGASAALAGVFGWSLGVHGWSAYLFLMLVALLGIGAIERVLERRRTPPPARTARSRTKVPRAGKAEYDLATDDRTDSQRYLM